VSVLMARDFRSEQKRTMATAGLADLTREQLSAI
jgi:hypothetical protein